MDYNYNQGGDPMLDSRAKTVLILGIVSIVCSLCCTYAGIIVGIVGLVKANSLARDAQGYLSPGAASNLKGGKICNIIGIAISAVTIVINIIMIATGSNELFNMLTELQ